MIPPAAAADLVRRTSLRLRPDPARVVNQLFVAGEEHVSGRSRVSPVMSRVLDLDDAAVEALLDATMASFDHRHPDLAASLLEHLDHIGDRLGAHRELSMARRMLLGAYATSEYALEAAGLCNPSIVAHPNQEGLAAGELRFVLSLRAIGEGHISSIEFRSGVVGADDTVTVDDPGALLTPGRHTPAVYDRETFRALLGNGSGDVDEIRSLILDALPETFSQHHLQASIAGLHPQVLTRRSARVTVEQITDLAAAIYTTTFAGDTQLGQRVIRPYGPDESNGLEDARLVHFVEDDGTATYYGTYTSYDGNRIAPKLAQTDDFQTFTMTPLTGRAATNKGLALFPRRIDGRYTALSRWDRVCNSVTTSHDAHVWDDPIEVQHPTQPWELTQLGNCGSPIETDEGWLVFTHGVGPMRTYSLGACLLDLDRPTQLRAALPIPLLSADEEERSGYVPNVVYTCGALRHGQTIVLPYAFGDAVTTVGLISLPNLLDQLLAG